MVGIVKLANSKAERNKSSREPTMKIEFENIP
jgi:hypothetical protein